MSTKHIISWLVTVAVTLGIQAAAEAQTYQPFGPVDFDSDVQLFAPVELDQLGGPMPANTGFFFTYERLYTATNRRDEDLDSADWGGDEGWGNRFDIGYMSEDSVHFDGSGWLVSILHNDGPSLVPDPFSDVDLDGFLDADDIELQPLNNVSWGGVEVMKTWRAKRRHYGSIFEPMVGIRYFYLKDDGFNDFEPDNVENQMVGPQVGVRWYKQNQRWIVSAEGRFMAAANFRHIKYTELQDTQFTPVAELRLEATYEIFHKAAVRVGYTGIFATDHIARTNLVYELTDQDLGIHALAFGFVFNR